MKVKSFKNRLLKNGKLISIFTILIMFLINVTPKADFIDKMKSGALKILNFIITSIADAIVSIMTKFGASIDSLVFNTSNGNIAILEGGKMTENLMNIYAVMMMIGVGVFSIKILLLSLKVMKAGDSPKDKAMMIESLKKSIFTVVLLTGSVFFFDLILTINNSLVDGFKSLNVAIGGDKFDGNKIMDIFKKLAKDDSDNFILAIGYLMSAVINVLLLGNYIVRDISISILFVLSPILIIQYQDQSDNFKNYVMALLTNIFNQSIHAFVFTIVLSFASAMGDKANMYQQFRLLAVFAMYIPLTTMVKKLIGLESDIGAGSSMAGIGGVISAIGVAGAIGKVGVSTFKDTKSAVRDYKNIGAEQKLNNISRDNPDSTDMSKFNTSEVGTKVEGSGATRQVDNNGGKLTSLRNGQEVDPNNIASANRNHGVQFESGQNYTATNRARQLAGSKAIARKNIGKTVLGGAGNMLGSLVGGSAGAVTGSKYGAMIGMKFGSQFGENVGEYVGEKTVGGYNNATETVKDLAYGKNVRYDGDGENYIPGIFDNVQKLDVKLKNPTDMYNDLKENIKDNVKQIGFNHDERVRIKSENRQASKTDEYQDRYLGIDKENLTPEQYKVEKNAVDRRNAQERLGKFDKAHRTYANKAANRWLGNQEPNNIKPETNEEPQEVKHSSSDNNINSSKDILRRKESEGNNKEYSNRYDNIRNSREVLQNRENENKENEYKNISNVREVLNNNKKETEELIKEKGILEKNTSDLKNIRKDMGPEFKPSIPSQLV